MYSMVLHQTVANDAVHVCTAVAHFVQTLNHQKKGSGNQIWILFKRFKEIN